MLLGSGMNEPPVRIESLSRDERLELLEKLWDSLSGTPGDVPVYSGSAGRAGSPVGCARPGCSQGARSGRAVG